MKNRNEVESMGQANEDWFRSTFGEGTSEGSQPVGPPPWSESESTTVFPGNGPNTPEVPFPDAPSGSYPPPPPPSEEEEQRSAPSAGFTEPEAKSAPSKAAIFTDIKTDLVNKDLIRIAVYSIILMFLFMWFFILPIPFAYVAAFSTLYLVGMEIPKGRTRSWWTRFGIAVFVSSAVFSLLYHSIF